MDRSHSALRFMTLGYILAPSCQSHEGNADASLVGTKKVRWHVRGSRNLQQPDRNTLKHTTVTIQMIVFGTAKDIAPIYPTSLGDVTSLHPKAGTEPRLAPREINQRYK